jgi:hypothetical protein
MFEHQRFFHPFLTSEVLSNCAVGNTLFSLLSSNELPSTHNQQYKKLNAKIQPIVPRAKFELMPGPNKGNCRPVNPHFIHNLLKSQKMLTLCYNRCKYFYRIIVLVVYKTTRTSIIPHFLSIIYC